MHFTHSRKQFLNMAAQQDDDEDIFANIVKTNFRTPCIYADEDDAVFLQAVMCPSSDAIVLPAQRSVAVHRHACGKSTSVTNGELHYLATRFLTSLPSDAL